MADKDYEATALDVWMTLLVFIPVNLFVSGFVFYKLWSWFAVPALHVPALSLGNAMGLGIMVAMLTTSVASTRKSRPWYDMLLLACIMDGFLLLIGFLVHSASA